MSYEKAVATCRKLRAIHQHDDAMMALIEEFGHNIALQRANDEITAMMMAQMAIEKARKAH